MTSLEVSFAGVRLRNPVIAASAPPTEAVESIIRCADAGVAAVVTKTLADFDHDEFRLGARRTYVDRRGMWALSTFRRETLTLAEGLALVEGAAARVDIPVIASIGALTMEPDAWVTASRRAVDAGARMVQLDLFYSPQPRSSQANVEALTRLLDSVCESVDVPVVPKLNVDLPAHHAAELLGRTPVTAVFAIDSLRVPVPLDPRTGHRPLSENVPNAPEASLFGGWQKPVTLQYVRTLAERTSLEVGAGGGFSNGYDAVEAMLLGASTVQFATAIIRHGYKRIPMLLEQIESYMVDNGHTSIDDFRGAALSTFATEEYDLDFVGAKAVVDHDLCTMCGHCTTLVFCPDVVISNSRVEVLDHCDGCGLCVTVCPTQPRALRLVRTGAPVR